MVLKCTEGSELVAGTKWGCEPGLSRPGEAQGFSQLGWLPLAMAGSSGRALPKQAPLESCTPQHLDPAFRICGSAADLLLGL